MTPKPIKRNPLKRKLTKARPGDNPEFLAWLRTWPCYVCLKRFCEARGLTFDVIAADPLERELIQYYFRRLRVCGPTEAAHVGLRCADREAMPLGKLHHLHQTAGGGPESHHTLGRHFWEFHGLDREAIFALLHRLYRAETGKEA